MARATSGPSSRASVLSSSLPTEGCVVPVTVAWERFIDGKAQALAG